MEIVGKGGGRGLHNYEKYDIFYVNLLVLISSRSLDHAEPCLNPPDRNITLSHHHDHNALVRRRRSL